MAVQSDGSVALGMSRSVPPSARLLGIVDATLLQIESMPRHSAEVCIVMKDGQAVVRSGRRNDQVDR
jgi:hypothetical protein